MQKYVIFIYHTIILYAKFISQTKNYCLWLTQNSRWYNFYTSNNESGIYSTILSNLIVFKLRIFFMHLFFCIIYNNDIILQSQMRILQKMQWWDNEWESEKLICTSTARKALFNQVHNHANATQRHSPLFFVAEHSAMSDVRHGINQLFHNITYNKILDRFLIRTTFETRCDIESRFFC